MPSRPHLGACPQARLGPILLPLLLLLLALGLGLGPLGSAPAYAHAALVSTEPAAGEEVAAIPAEVVLRFNENIAAGLALVTVTDGEGLAMTDGKAQVSGESVHQRLQPGLAAGSYLVRFKVTSADGHPISDAYSFTIPEDVAAAGASEPGTSAATSPPATSSPAATQSLPSASASPSGTAQAAAGASTTAATQVSPRAQTITTLWLVLILAILALVTVLAVIAWRGRKARGVHGAHGRFD